MSHRLPRFWAALLLMALLIPTAAYAHGTAITADIDGTLVTIEALFDTGLPMADAQIAIFAPDNPEQVWQRGSADSEGNFSFEYNPDISGEWAVSIRAAAHGEIIYFTVDGGAVTAVQTNEQNPIVRYAITGGVLVGLLGIAAYFMQTPKQKAAETMTSEESQKTGTPVA